MMRFLLGFVVLLVVLVTAVYFSLGGIVKAAINSKGSEIVGTEVSVDAVSISLFSGQATIRGLTVQNPEGYSDNPAFVLDEILVDLEPASLLSSTIHINQIAITGPTFRYERGITGTNIGALQKASKKEAPEDEVEETTADEPSDSGQNARVEIDVVTLTDGQVVVALSAAGAELPMPDITIEDIGKEGGGTSFASAIYLVLGTILKTIVQLNPIDAVKGVGDAVKGVADGLNSLF